MTAVQAFYSLFGSRLVRTFAGLVFAPIVGITSTLPILLLQHGYSSYFAALTDSLEVSIKISILPALIFGLPLHALILLLRWPRAVVYMALGSFLAAPAMLVFLAMLTTGFAEKDWSIADLLLFASGGFGGLVFWLIRRPDRDADRSAESVETSP